MNYTIKYVKSKITREKVNNMELYVFSFDGTMFYTTGNLTNEQINLIERFVDEPMVANTSIPKEESLKELLKKIEYETNAKLTILPISHVFRFDFL